MSWRAGESELVARTPVFSVRRDRKIRTGSLDRSHEFYVIEAVDWVNVIPVTPEREIVLIELYRHGIESWSLEIPGGMIDPEDADPMAAAAREMEEETGYVAERLQPLGVVHPNPAIQNNRCHTFLAENARPLGEPRPDDTEDIRVVLHPLDEVPRLLREGRITHALVVAGLLFYLERETSGR